MSMTSELTSDSPTTGVDFINRFSEKLNIKNSNAVLCEIRKELFNNEDGSFLINCNNCDFTHKLKNFVELNDGQTKVKTFKCKKCKRISAVKIYVDIAQKLLSNQVSYKIFSCANTVCKSIFRNCQWCNKQLTVRAIPQDEFLASETIICDCKKVNTVYVHGNELHVQRNDKLREQPRSGDTPTTSTSAPHKQWEQAEAFVSGLTRSPVVTSTTSNRFDSHRHNENQARSLSNESSVSSNSANSRSLSSKRKLTEIPAMRKNNSVSKNTKVNEKEAILINDTRYKFSNVEDNKKAMSDKLISDLSRILAAYEARIIRNNTSKNILITVTDLDKRRLCIEEIKKFKPDLAFIAAQPRAEQIRTTKIIIRNMTYDHTHDEQLDEMERCIGIRPLSIKRITIDVQLCIFDGSFSYKELSEKMRNATAAFFCAYKINPQRYITNSDRILQCKNCLRFNHATSACYAQKRNPTINIVNSHGKTITVCANCRDVKPEQHTATQRKCPYFQWEMNKQQTKREEALLRKKKHNTLQQQARKRATPREHQSRPRGRQMRGERSYANVTANIQRQEESVSVDGLQEQHVHTLQATQSFSFRY